MTLPGIVQFGLIVALVVAGVVAERYLRRTAALVSVPAWVRTTALGVALASPWALYHQRVLVAPVLGDLVAPLALSLVLWVGATALVGVGRGAGDGSAC